MRAPRVYLDTSVVGGCEDEEFKVDSLALFRDSKQGLLPEGDCPAMTTKTFDCVEMKHAIQAQLLAREEQMGHEQARLERKRWLLESQGDLALFWRRSVGKSENGTRGLP